LAEITKGTSAEKVEIHPQIITPIKDNCLFANDYGYLNQ